MPVLKKLFIGWHVANMLEIIMFIVCSYYTVAQISEQRSKTRNFHSRLLELTISIDLEMLVVCPAGQKNFFWKNYYPHSQEGESNWIKRGAGLTLILLMWKIWGTPNNASKWQWDLIWHSKGLIQSIHCSYLQKVNF